MVRARWNVPIEDRRFRCAIAEVLRASELNRGYEGDLSRRNSNRIKLHSHSLVQYLLRLRVFLARVNHLNSKEVPRLTELSVIFNCSLILYYGTLQKTTLPYLHYP